MVWVVVAANEREGMQQNNTRMVLKITCFIMFTKLRSARDTCRHDKCMNKTILDINYFFTDILNDYAFFLENMSLPF